MPRISAMPDQPRPSHVCSRFHSRPGAIVHPAPDLFGVRGRRTRRLRDGADRGGRGSVPPAGGALVRGHRREGCPRARRADVRRARGAVPAVHSAPGPAHSPWAAYLPASSRTSTPSSWSAAEPTRSAAPPPTTTSRGSPTRRLARSSAPPPTCGRATGPRPPPPDPGRRLPESFVRVGDRLHPRLARRCAAARAAPAAGDGPPQPLARQPGNPARRRRPRLRDGRICRSLPARRCASDTRRRCRARFGEFVRRTKDARAI